MDRKFTPMSQELFCEDELLCYEVRSKGTGETYFLTAYEYFYTDCNQSNLSARHQLRPSRSAP